MVFFMETLKTWKMDRWSQVIEEEEEIMSVGTVA